MDDLFAFVLGSFHKIEKIVEATSITCLLWRSTIFHIMWNNLVVFYFVCHIELWMIIFL